MQDIKHGILELNQLFGSNEITGVEYFTKINGILNNSFHKPLLERTIIEDLYRFEYGYPQAITMNLATGIPINRIKEILRSIDYYSKFGIGKKQKDFRKVYAYHVDHIWHLDLMEFTNELSEENNGFRYCLVCIDVCPNKY